MKILQINATVNSGSDGRISEEIGRLLISGGHKSFIAYGRSALNSYSHLIKIGNRADQASHLLKSRLFDRHGFGSVNSTITLIRSIREIDPDVIHLHNLHGYYLNVKVLFQYLKVCKKPIVWTLHDCWPFTGHCSHFEHFSCEKWKKGCFDCPNLAGYPGSIFLDNSRLNFKNKKELFTGVPDMILISPSEWLAGLMKDSFLFNNEIRVINNGIALDKFRPLGHQTVKEKFQLNNKYILGVASKWTVSKGLSDFNGLRKSLDPEIDIVLVGMKQKQIKNLNPSIKCIPRTEDMEELASIYSLAEVYVNPTYADNFPSTNIEALACGTPVVTYNTGGCDETISPQCGISVPKGDIASLHNSILEIIAKGKHNYRKPCRERAEKLFNKDDRFSDYIRLYRELVNNSNEHSFPDSFKN